MPAKIKKKNKMPEKKYKYTAKITPKPQPKKVSKPQYKKQLIIK